MKKQIKEIKKVEEVVEPVKEEATPVIPVVTVYEQNGKPYKKVTTLNGEVISIERL